jgi:hypothetical protein
VIALFEVSRRAGRASPSGRELAIGGGDLCSARRATEDIEDALARVEDGLPPLTGADEWAGLQLAASTSPVRPAVCSPPQVRAFTNLTSENP